MRFYRLSYTSAEKILPALVEKIYNKGQSILIVTPLQSSVTVLDQILWTYTPLAFLPHGCSEKQDIPSEHPIWITTSPRDITRDVILLLEGAEMSSSFSDENVLVLFSPYKQEECLWAEALHAQSRTPAVFWEQTEKGWSQTAPCFSFLP